MQETKEMKPLRATDVQRVEWQEVGDSQDSLPVCTSMLGIGEGVLRSPGRWTPVRVREFRN